MSNLAVVARYSFPLDAQIAKSNLESAGIAAYIADEHTINMQWLYSDALGGVRVLVAVSDLEEAREILGEDFSPSVIEASGSGGEEVSERCCSYCGSRNMALYTKGKKSAFVIFILLGFPLFFYQHGIKCNACGKFTKN